MAQRQPFVRGSYTWSHYYGNFDQDNTTTANDANVFIGSSFIGDGAGRQLWDFNDGDLRGDRRAPAQALRLLRPALERDGSAPLSSPSPASRGRRGTTRPTSPLTHDTSDRNRYAEPAGSRRTTRTRSST